MRPDLRPCVLAAAMAAALPASAVTLNPDGLGQALIYPYYTAQSSGTDAFNTYLSVVNHSGDAKALRLRFREGRLGKSALELNLYLSPNDVWTGVVVPFDGGARVMSADRSCADPPLGTDFGLPGELAYRIFSNAAFSGTNDDGAGAGLDRTREGFVEILEMGKLTGAAAAAVTHNSAGVPSNCAALASITPLVEAPTGGLSGTLTLINVASGMDFTLNAEALDGLAQRPYFRAASDPYPNFNAAEIDPVSLVEANGSTWRSLWDNPVDAVSAVLMRSRAMGEFVVDEPTASLTDFVITLPTRHFHTNATAAAAPFSKPGRWAPDCGGGGSTAIGEPLGMAVYNRDELAASTSDCLFLCPPSTPTPAICADSGVFTVRNNALRQFSVTSNATTLVLGSVTRGAGSGSGPGTVTTLSNTIVSNGWISVISALPDSAALVSRAQSTRTEASTGVTTTGGHVFKGLPMLGFTARIFRNGTLRCDAGACQGNYGGAFPMKYRRAITTN